MSASDPSVADLLAWGSWTREQQDIARAALFEEMEEFETDLAIAREGKDEAEEALENLQRLVREEVDVVGRQLAVARDTGEGREARRLATRLAEEAIERIAKEVAE